MEIDKSKPVEEILNEVVKDTAAAGDVKTPLPKGDVIDKKLSEPVAEEAPKKKRGRKGEARQEPEPVKPEPVPAIDVITPTINALIIPIAAKKLKRNPTDLMYTKEEEEMLFKLQPPNDFSKPNWIIYGITAVSMIVVKYFQTEEIKPLNLLKEKPEERPKNPREIIPEAKVIE